MISSNRVKWAKKGAPIVLVGVLLFSLTSEGAYVMMFINAARVVYVLWVCTLVYNWWQRRGADNKARAIPTSAFAEVHEFDPQENFPRVSKKTGES